jgi:hypothetical protein
MANGTSPRKKGRDGEKERKERIIDPSAAYSGFILVLG